MAMTIKYFKENTTAFYVRLLFNKQLTGSDCDVKSTGWANTVLQLV